MKILSSVSTGLCSLVLMVGCSSKYLKYDKEKDLRDIKDYEKRVEIKEISPAETPPPPQVKEASVVESSSAGVKSTTSAASAKKIENKATAKNVKKVVKSGPREPKMEDAQGFEGRRPIVDPFRVNEKVTLSVTYFNIKAGEIDLVVKPFVEFNKSKSYSFEVDLKSYSFFSRIYTVDDHALTYVDYESLRPHNLSITIKESKQLAETRTLFDWDKNKATYWRKKVTDDKGEQTKELDWKILPYSQNVISALFYLRTFQLEPGKKLAFRVADEGKNIVFTGNVLRREVLKTAIGDMKTLVIQPIIEVEGAFKPVGDILLWLTDDDRKFLVRVESKIKIGTLVAKLKSIDKGLE